MSHVCVWGGGGRVRVCVCRGGGGGKGVPIKTLRVRSPPSTVSHVLLAILWVATNSQMCMSEYVWWKNKVRKFKIK